MAVNPTAQTDHGMIYIDVPAEDAARSAIPEPAPGMQANRWRFHFPWVKTAVGAPTYSRELLIANCTDRAWLLWHNYHGLGLLNPGCSRHVQVVRAGTISARLHVADTDTEYLLLALTPDLTGIEIVDMSSGEGYFELRRMEAVAPNAGNLPDSAGIEELSLSPKTEHALKRIGVFSVGELDDADLGQLWDVYDGPAAYVELLDLLYLRRVSGGG